jgi:hypothetical protein
VCAVIFGDCSVLKVRILQHDFFSIHRTASNYAKYEVTTQVSIKKNHIGCDKMETNRNLPTFK